MQQLMDGLNGLTMQDEQYKCFCGSDLTEVNIEPMHEMNMSDRVLLQLRKTYVCTNQTYQHPIDLCIIPGCKSRCVFRERGTNTTSMLIHMIHHHDDASSRFTQDGVFANISIPNEYYVVRLDMSSILRIIPQYFGLKCEIPLSKIVQDLFSGMSDEHLDGMYFCVGYGDDNFNTVINILANELDYSCALCGDYCGKLPPMEVYAAHVREAHGR